MLAAALRRGASSSSSSRGGVLATTLMKTRPAAVVVFNYKAVGKRGHHDDATTTQPSATRPGEAALEPGIVEKYQLSSPSRFIPITVGAAGVATATGLYHWDAESQILGLFVLFVGTIYAKGGSTMAAMLDETSRAILKEQNALEDAQIAATKLAIAAHERQTDVYKDIQQIFEGQRALMDTIVATSTNRVKHDVRNKTQRLLDQLVTVEQSASDTVQKDMVESATKRVQAVFAKGKPALKAKALNQALKMLKNPKAKPEKKKDLVGAAYSKYFAAFRKKADGMKKKPIELKPAVQAVGAESAKTFTRITDLEKLKVKVPSSVTLNNVI
jgi:hypothetical protein